MSVLAERKTESIGFPMTTSTSLSSPNGMLKVTADKGRLQRRMDVDTPAEGWRTRMEKQRPQKPTEGDLKRMNPAEDLHLQNIKLQNNNYLIGFFVQLLVSGRTARRTS